MKGVNNLLVITQWSFKDPLIQAYTLPYVYMIAEIIPTGSKIYLVTFEQVQWKMSNEEKGEIISKLKSKGIILLDYSYSRFGVIAFIKWFFCFIQLFFICLFQKISHIHAWCTTAGSLGYVLSITTGKPLVVDSYEPHAEAMAENGTWSKNDFKFKLLFYLERKLSHRAKVIISATEGMHEYAIRKYSIDLKNFYVKPACVDLHLFNPSKRKNNILLEKLNLKDKIVCVYAGKFGGIYLTNEVFDFCVEAEKVWGDRFRMLLLTAENEINLIKMAKERKFDPAKMIVRLVPHEQIPDYIGLGDFAITPVKPIPTKKYCTPIKDGEYWAMGLPVVITEDISDDSDIIKRYNVGAVIQNLNPESYSKTINEIKFLLEGNKDELTKKITGIAKEFRSFEIARKIYRTIYG